MKIPRSFIQQFPVLNQWLDLQFSKAYRIPEKVQRRNVPRGELYPLTRDKILFALMETIRPLLRLNLKGLANELNIPYVTVRHWIGEDRVKARINEYAREFADYFMKDLETVLTEMAKDEKGESGRNAMELESLKDEAAGFSELIQEAFADALLTCFNIPSKDKLLEFRLLKFVDSLLWRIKLRKSTISLGGIERLYRLAHEVTKRELELHFDYFENQLKTDPNKALCALQELKSDMRFILKRKHFLELAQCEIPEPRQERKKGGTRGGLIDPVDKRRQETA